jgi:hypothetical protein
MHPPTYLFPTATATTAETPAISSYKRHDHRTSTSSTSSLNTSHANSNASAIPPLSATSSILTHSSSPTSAIDPFLASSRPALPSPSPSECGTRRSMGTGSNRRKFGLLAAFFIGCLDDVFSWRVGVRHLEAAPSPRTKAEMCEEEKVGIDSVRVLGLGLLRRFGAHSDR